MDSLTPSDAKDHRPLIVRYALLTAALFVPQALAFVANATYFPFQRWALYSETIPPGQGYIYYILSGEPATGKLIDLPPHTLTGGLTARNFMLVYYTVENESFKISYPHPENVRFMERHNINPGARMPDLLRAWGEIYNRRLPPNSPRRLVRIRLDGFRWDGDDYANYRNPVGGWVVDL